MRSPVCNLRQRYGDANHEQFVTAVVDAFREEYGIYEEVCARGFLQILFILSGCVRRSTMSETQMQFKTSDTFVEAWLNLRYGA